MCVCVCRLPGSGVECGTAADRCTMIHRKTYLLLNLVVWMRRRAPSTNVREHHRETCARSYLMRVHTSVSVCVLRDSTRMPIAPAASGVCVCVPFFPGFATLYSKARPRVSCDSISRTRTRARASHKKHLSIDVRAATGTKVVRCVCICARFAVFFCHCHRAFCINSGLTRRSLRQFARTRTRKEAKRRILFECSQDLPVHMHACMLVSRIVIEASARNFRCRPEFASFTALICVCAAAHAWHTHARSRAI